MPTTRYGRFYVSFLAGDLLDLRDGFLDPLHRRVGPPAKRMAAKTGSEFPDFRMVHNPAHGFGVRKRVDPRSGKMLVMQPASFRQGQVVDDDCPGRSWGSAVVPLLQAARRAACGEAWVERLFTGQTTA